ncbi:hypothetical protein A2973_01100 [Candidatus Gottesmanbacteria bacterium RIFCSPLOWO2_01_FULL_49_10]|uniref:Uncharacterized protein n=1 Tax=Candidatus Gottesmanbacteria bacterium RIFCSPLOWO2_01_FULL_49_10 TaxID=1798396 RepID=A0A1F6AZY3_9BACT|nr:MAG: hypothetical protein A2973_01100 [Candidatus Gottesmanbacteria bacterium RIFCSPLOWO2_01_FULL_49_10]
MWGVLKPERGKLEIKEIADIQKIYDFASVYGVSCQTVRMPRQDALSMTHLDLFQHFGKLFATGALGGFGFRDELYYFQV